MRRCAYSKFLPALAFAVWACGGATLVPRDKLEYAKTCRGWITVQAPAREVSRVFGKTSLQGAPFPGVDLFLVDANGRPRFSAVSGASGVFTFGRVPDGEYVLKTCRDGIDTIEIRIIVNHAIPSAQSIELALNLSA